VLKNLQEGLKSDAERKKFEREEDQPFKTGSFGRFVEDQKRQVMENAKTRIRMKPKEK